MKENERQREGEVRRTRMIKQRRRRRQGFGSSEDPADLCHGDALYLFHTHHVVSLRHVRYSLYTYSVRDFLYTTFSHMHPILFVCTLFSSSIYLVPSALSFPEGIMFLLDLSSLLA